MKKILLADDEENIRTLVLATVEDSGYEILEAVDGARALELARAHRPDLAIMDWMMPGMTGVEVTRALRAEPGNEGTRIILLTARSRDEDRDEGREAGADAFLTKPFSPLQLLDEVDHLLGRS